MIVGASGQRLGIQRRKGIRDTLLDDRGSPLADGDLAAVLGMVDRDFFTSIFALGSEELREGAEALLHGRGELGQALLLSPLGRVKTPSFSWQLQA